MRSIVTPPNSPSVLEAAEHYAPSNCAGDRQPRRRMAPLARQVVGMIRTVPRSTSKRCSPSPSHAASPARRDSADQSQCDADVAELAGLWPARELALSHRRNLEYVARRRIVDPPRVRRA